MRVSRVAVVLIAGLLATASVTRGEGFYRTSGTTILDPAGNAFLIKGNDLSHWNNTEAYSLRLNAVHSRHFGSESSIKTRIREIVGETNAATFWDAFTANFLTETDVASFAAEGFNTIRFSFNYRLVSPAATPGVYSAEGFAVMDQVVAWCKSNNMAVVLDMHACPGGQSHDGPSDPEWTYWYYSSAITNWLETGVPCLWTLDTNYYAATGRTPAFNKQRMADIWQTIANRYKDEPAVLGYELMNEPWLPTGVTSNDLRALLMNVTAAIRAVDTNHMIMVEGDQFSGSLAGLVPPWDSNMALCFHRYWCSTAQSAIQPFVDVANQYSLPLIMTESGENSNPWLYEFARRLETNNIGWMMWGYKKVDNIASAFSAQITPDYQYVINNFRDLPINAVQAMSGLMQCATNLQTALCDFDPGWFDALLSPTFNSQGYPFVTHTLPCVINSVEYDVGNQGVAYSDTDYKNEGSGYYNSGWVFRNDGVDITTTTEGCGYKIAWINSGEWTRYTVDVPVGGTYNVLLRTATPNRNTKLQLKLDGVNLGSQVAIPKGTGYENWRTSVVSGVTIPAGQHVIEANYVVGGFDFAGMTFVLTSIPTAAAPTFSPNGGTYTSSVSVTLSSSTAGATIYYTTDGSQPTTGSASVPSGSSIVLNQPYANSIRAFAAASGYQNSAVATSAAFSVVPAPLPPAAAPTFSPNGGTYTDTVSVTLSSSTEDATIYYTTDGSQPTTGSVSVASGSAIVLSYPYASTIKALAAASGYQNSAVSISALFNVVSSMPEAAAPTFSPNGGTYTSSVSVTLSSSTAGATIYYTTDGSQPTTGSASVPSGSSIVLNQPYANSIRAMATASGFQNSAIATSAAFSVVAVPVPLQLLNGALTGTGTAPTSWLSWGDAYHDPDTATYRSGPNSWVFWYDGGIYQDITNGFSVGQTITFGGYMRHPSTDALRSGTKYGIIQVEFRTAADVLISTLSTAQINKNSTKNTWLSFQSSGTVPANTARIRLIVRCNNFTSGSGRFFADDLYVQ